MKKRRLLLGALALLLVLALGLWWFFWQRGSSERIATVTLDGEVIAQYDLSRIQTTETFTVSDGDNVNVIKVSPAGIAVTSANCPDQICVNQGCRSHGPQPIVCLPHKLSITFSAAANDVDAVAGS